MPHRKAIGIGQDDLDLGAVEQLVDESQTRAVAEALMRLTDDRQLHGLSVPELLDALEQEIAKRGLDALTRAPRGDLARFRRFELAAALNRLRALKTG